MCFGWSEAVGVCGSCTLAVLVGCGLSSVLCSSVSFLLPLTPLMSFSVASLQGVAQDSMLSRIHCLTLSLLSVIFSVLLKPPAASTALQPPLPPPVNLCRGSASLSFSALWGDPLSSVRLTCFLLLISFGCQTPSSPLPAVRSPMVQCCACLQFCGWSVGLSPVHVKLCQLILCCGLSSEWTMCIKLHRFLVWHRLIPTFRVFKCHVEVMLPWKDFPISRIQCGDFWERQLKWQWKRFWVNITFKKKHKRKYWLSKPVCLLQTWSPTQEHCSYSKTFSSGFLAQLFKQVYLHTTFPESQSTSIEGQKKRTKIKQVQRKKTGRC